MIWFEGRDFVRRRELGLRLEGVLWANEWGLGLFGVKWGLGLFGVNMLFRHAFSGYDPTEKRIVYLNWQVVPCSSG